MDRNERNAARKIAYAARETQDALVALAAGNLLAAHEHARLASEVLAQAAATLRVIPAPRPQAAGETGCALDINSCGR